MKFAPSDLRLTSPAFAGHGQIPSKHTGEGEDVSPALEWTSAPEGTRSFALICHDPDAPVVAAGGYGFVHWVCYNIPGSATGLGEGEGGPASGPNNFGNSGYGGPMPPNGHGTHHYYFWLLALDRDPDLAPGLDMQQLLDTVEDNVLGMNRLIGTYKRD